MYSLDEILRMSVEEKASDIHFTAGCPPYYRIDGVLTPLKGDKLLPTDLETLLLPILDNRHRNELETNGQTDLAYAIPGVGRFRVNVHNIHQRRQCCGFTASGWPCHQYKTSLLSCQCLHFRRYTDGNHPFCPFPSQGFQQNF